MILFIKDSSDVWIKLKRVSLSICKLQKTLTLLQNPGQFIFAPIHDTGRLRWVIKSVGLVFICEDFTQLLVTTIESLI